MVDGIDPAVLDAYEAMVAGVPGVERKGATMPYTAINGNMYSAISKSGVIGLRLAKVDLAEFLALYGSGLFEGTPGYVSKEYAAVPAALLGDAAVLRDWFRRSHEYATTLKARKTTR